MIVSWWHLAVRISRLPLTHWMPNVKRQTYENGLSLIQTQNTSLASATVAQTTGGWRMQVVDVVSSTVLYIYVSGPGTTAARPMKTHSPAHSTVTNTGMISIQPAWRMRTTTVLWHAAIRHLWSRCSWESVPVVYKITVTHVTSPWAGVIVKLGTIHGIEEWIGITGIWKRRWKIIIKHYRWIT